MLYSPGEDWVPVAGSCFGGFAVYRRSAIEPCDGTYSGIKDCEHVIFSKCIRDHGGKLFMNPTSWIRYPVFSYFP